MIGKFGTVISAASGGGGGGTLTTNLIEYTSSDTWTKPAGLILIEVVCVGAGGGAASGARRASGTSSLAGAGAGSGTVVFREILASNLNNTENVTIGAGGNGGASVTTNNTAQTAGGVGGNTSFGAHVLAIGGNRSTGTVASSFIPIGTASTPDWPFGFIGSAASGRADTVGGTGLDGGNQSFQSAYAGQTYSINQGGGGGGGITSGNLATRGGRGGRIYNSSGTLSVGATGGIVGGAGENGQDDYSGRLCQSPAITEAGATKAIGTAGGGGGAGATVNAGGGGNGGLYGGAGGGGGASRNGYASGKGGDGAAGLCLVLEYIVS